jgi:S1-C subfamily serine protease
MGKVQKWGWILFTVAIFFALAGYSNSIAKTEDEENNISIYRQVGPGVVNITRVVVERDFFFNPIPREGAGSGSIIDSAGHILTNHHVI